MRRREFLRRTAHAALALTGLAALDHLAGSPFAAAAPTSTRALRRLASDLKGRLVVPASPDYEAARRLFNTRFDGVRPLAIAYCRDAADVSVCLRWSAREHVQIAVRNGGHSAGGYSTTRGLVIDVSQMNHVSVDAGGRAVLGAGSLLGRIYPTLLRLGLTIPAGTCPGVGISGLALGGGVGYLTNLLGTTSDNLVAVDLVTAEGRPVRCDEAHHADLFWACRGGGGGNFGVATALTFRAHRVDEAAYAVFDWDLADARAVLDAWQRWAPDSDDRLTSTCEASAAAGSPRQQATLTVSVQFTGPQRMLSTLLQPFLRDAGARPLRRTIRAASYEDVVRFWLSREAPGTQRATVKNKTHFITGLLPREGIERLVGALEARRKSGLLTTPGGFWMQALGGRYGRIAPEATAFVHRKARLLIQYLAKWESKAPAVTVDENLRWVNGFYRAMDPFASGAYQNFMDPDLTDWATAYYGANLPRLSRIKRSVDPGNRFRFRQSVPTG